MPKNSLVAGAPDIAHPSDGEKYEQQLAFVTAWFFEMWERMASDEKAGHEARCELQTWLLNTIGRVLMLALADKESGAKKWAGELLAIIEVYAKKRGKHDKKLKSNTAYAEMKKKLSGKGLTSALFPTYVCGVAQQEWKKAERYRKRLLLRKGCAAALEAEKRKIAEVYWPFMDVLEFSESSEPQWWKLLWPLIQKKINLSKLDSRYKMARKRHYSDSENTARGHLTLLALLKDAGILY